MGSCAGAFPINDPEAIKTIDNSNGAQLFVIYTNHEGIFSFFHDAGRPVIIINIVDLSKLDNVLSTMKKVREIDVNNMYELVQ